VHEAGTTFQFKLKSGVQRVEEEHDLTGVQLVDQAGEALDVHIPACMSPTPVLNPNSKMEYSVLR
jgi:hypothetical protein